MSLKFIKLRNKIVLSFTWNFKISERIKYFVFDIIYMDINRKVYL